VGFDTLTRLKLQRAMARSLAAGVLLGGAAAAGPRVVFTVVIDDLGFNNLAWHGNAEASTPHLAALAAEGITLNRHYTHFTCTPSRSAFMTGRLPVHVQTTLANPDVQTAGIPRNMTTFPNKLRDAG
jgi:arylsulfatase B